MLFPEESENPVVQGGQDPQSIHPGQGPVTLSLLMADVLSTGQEAEVLAEGGVAVYAGKEDQQS